MAKTSPTQRALKDLKAMGFTCAVVERWNSFVKRRQDLFGCIDILGVREGFGVLGVQATSNTSSGNHMARVKKALAEPRLRAWLASGCRFEVWSYSQRGARGARKTYQLRRQVIRLADLPAEPPAEVPVLAPMSSLFEREQVA